MQTGLRWESARGVEALGLLSSRAELQCNKLDAAVALVDDFEM